MYNFGHRQVKTKQKVVALPAVLRQEIDEEAEVVRDQVSDGYSVSEALDVGDAKDREDPIEMQTWEDAGLEHSSETEGYNRTSGSGGGYVAWNDGTDDTFVRDARCR